jgi:hypothetical protein
MPTGSRFWNDRVVTINEAERDESDEPVNQLGQPPTKSPEEAVDRLREKIEKNHGGANRERIRAQILEERSAQ